jgi:hypothetical protein
MLGQAKDRHLMLQSRKETDNQPSGIILVISGCWNRDVTFDVTVLDRPVTVGPDDQIAADPTGGDLSGRF